MAQPHPSGPAAAHETPADDRAPRSDDGADSPVDESDSIENGCMLYPVFCIADTPAKVLDSLITQARNSFPPSGGAALCVLTSSDPAANTHGTRVPTQDLRAPFRGLSITELASFFLTKFGSGWSQRVFGVLDAQSASSILLVTVEDGSDNGAGGGSAHVLYYRCEFGCSIDQMIAYEESGLRMENDAQDLLGTDDVFTVERFDGMMNGTWKWTGAEGDGMGKSYMGPEGTGRVKGL